jgi:hypothetical protein
MGGSTRFIFEIIWKVIIFGIDGVLQHIHVKR